MFQWLQHIWLWSPGPFEKPLSFFWKMARFPARPVSTPSHALPQITPLIIFSLVISDAVIHHPSLLCWQYHWNRLISTETILNSSNNCFSILLKTSAVSNYCGCLFSFLFFFAAVHAACAAVAVAWSSRRAAAASTLYPYPYGYDYQSGYTSKDEPVNNSHVKSPPIL